MTSLLFRRQQQQLISVICRNTRSISSDDKRRLRDDRPESFTLDGERFDVDKWWNLSPLVIDRLRHRRLLDETGNPLNLLKRRIIDHLHANYRKPASGSPLFVICERLHRIVSLWQNYDSLLTPIDHISRQPSDAYYVNAGHVLRAHTSAHQHELIAQGLDNFVVIGDVYRRDEVDRNHYPCFHQLEGVRLFSADQLFDTRRADSTLRLFETDAGIRDAQKQECHTIDCAQALELNLKNMLESFAKSLFSQDVEMRWIDAYFPFTHPSFELEVYWNDEWIELLGCGIIEQKILQFAGADSKVGWAFGIGLDRLAMIIYSIPDIRLLWSRDSGFLNQFADKSPTDDIVYKPISKQPQVIFDVAFWLPESDNSALQTSNINDLIRTIGGDLVEQVHLIDNFVHPNTQRRSHCYRIIYRSMDRVLTKTEVNNVHNQLKHALVKECNVTMR